MPQYAIFIYEQVPPEELPAEVMAGHEGLPARIAALGARELAGLALQPAETATAIRDGVLTDGPFVETKEAMAGVFVVEARDLDQALEIGRMVPIVDGGVEVRPLLGFALSDAAPEPVPQEEAAG